MKENAFLSLDLYVTPENSTAIAAEDFSSTDESSKCKLIQVKPYESPPDSSVVMFLDVIKSLFKVLGEPFWCCD